MSDLNNTIPDPYQFLEKISTEELKRLLREDLESEDESSPANDAFITRVMEVVAQREKDIPSASSFDTAAGWENFQKNYYPTGEDPILLCTDETLKELSCENRVVKSAHQLSASMPKTAGRRMRLIALIAATIGAFMSLLVVAQAMGLDVFGSMARWTDETFHFAVPPVNDEVMVIRSALEAQGIPVEYAPTWIPEGFEAEDPQIGETKRSATITIRFSNGDDRFLFAVTKSAAKDPLAATIYEKDLGDAVPYSNGRQLFYIFENTNNVMATWSDGESFAINISGTISSDDIRSMIDSIGG